MFVPGNQHDRNHHKSRGQHHVVAVSLQLQTMLMSAILRQHNSWKIKRQPCCSSSLRGKYNK